MEHLQSLPWAPPLDYAQNIDESHWVLLYSGIQESYSGQYSLLACDLAEIIETDDFNALETKLSKNQSKYTNTWFGYFGYELKNSLEDMPNHEKQTFPLKPLCFMRFNTILEFDHHTQTIQCHSTYANPKLPKPSSHILEPLPQVSGKLSSNMTRESYLSNVKEIIERIHAGDFYQANLTRKFTGSFSSTPNPISLFKKLCTVSPAPYSAFIKLDENTIISSSPELFLKIDSDGNIRTRPIKGTTPRFTDPTQDKASKLSLANSEKDKAENLMIVDLMRNDLSRSCLAGSVQVTNMFDITSHSNVHHMSSTIVGEKNPDTSTLQAIAQAFPPGSMTGAPKIIAMKTLSKLEKLARGVYSGAIGWLGGDGSAELSVVIRTILLNKNNFEFQVGGGIVADSTPEGELQEIIDKSAGMLITIGLNAGSVP